MQIIRHIFYCYFFPRIIIQLCKLVYRLNVFHKIYFLFQSCIMRIAAEKMPERVDSFRVICFVL